MIKKKVEVGSRRERGIYTVRQSERQQTARQTKILSLKTNTGGMAKYDYKQ